MSKRGKLFKTGVAVGMLISSFRLNVLAEDIEEPKDDHADSTTLEFRDYSFTTNEIDPDARVVYSSSEYSESYLIIDPDTNLVLQEYVVEYPEDNNGTRGTTATNFYQYNNIYSGMYLVCQLRFGINVQYYSSGSFKQFEGLNWVSLVITSSITPYTITNESKGAWPLPIGGGYPCTSMGYSYTCNLQTTYTIGIGGNLRGLLEGAGFTATEDWYYYRTVDSSGSFNLY